MKVLKRFGFLMLALMLVGCATTGFIAEDRHIPLKANGPHKGSDSTSHVEVNYTFTVKPAGPDSLRIMDISGTVRGRTVHQRSKRLTRLNVDLNFVDAQGNILDTARVFFVGQKWPQSAWTFDRRLGVPPETVAFAFSSSYRKRQGR